MKSTTKTVYRVMKGTSLKSEHIKNVSCNATRNKATENVKLISQRIYDEDDDDMYKFNATSKS